MLRKALISACLLTLADCMTVTDDSIPLQSDFGDSAISAESISFLAQVGQGINAGLGVVEAIEAAGGTLYGVAPN